MNCEQFRTAVTAEPSSSSPELTAHAAECPACAQYWQELRDMDRLIHRALSVSVPAQVPSPARTPRRLSWGLAASLLLTMSIAASIWLAGTRETLAEQVVEHALHEPDSLRRTSTSVDAARLDGMLSDFGLRLKSNASQVSYAQNCRFRGHQVPHLVVQTESGPVTVLVLQEEAQRTTSERIDEEGFQGVVMPAPRGVLVVLGQNVPVDAVARTLLDALEYEPRQQQGAVWN